MTQEQENVHLGSLGYYDQVLFDFQSDFHHFGWSDLMIMHYFSALFFQKCIENVSNERVYAMLRVVFMFQLKFIAEQ